MQSDPGTRNPAGIGDRGRSATVCVCPQCGYKVPATPEIPCYLLRCPRCDLALVGR